MANEGKMKKHKPRRFYDYSLLFTIIFLTAFGLVMIYSSSYYSAQLSQDGNSFSDKAGADCGGGLCLHAVHIEA